MFESSEPYERKHEENGVFIILLWVWLSEPKPYVCFSDSAHTNSSSSRSYEPGQSDPIGRKGNLGRPTDLEKRLPQR